MRSIIVAALLFGCAAKHIEIDAGLEQDVRRFAVEMAERGVYLNLDGLDIYYADDLPPSENGRYYKRCPLGQCTCEIKIKGESISMRQSIVVWHELAHCYLNRLHDDEMLFFDKPKTIMHKRSSDFYRVISEDLEYYFDELGGVQ